ncbi:hypothetical protein [Clostridium vitabionis]|uniref:hypothetical protein n=1 Tax=Clostridium vitabionis TaxID=2784388 RepID=UPI00188B847E|nr:hypothetical protein [Clostridium vitabionis]
MIPHYLILGEYDVDSWDFQQTGANANKCSTTVSYYLNRNGLADSANPTEVRENGRYKTNIWKNEAGIPLFKFGQTAERNHNCIPSEMPMLYEWFSHWSQAADGMRLYDGKSIKLHADKPSDNTESKANSERSGRRGNSSKAEYTKGYYTGNQKNSGNWKMDAKGWWFRYVDGTYPQGTWKELSWNGKNKWYHFDTVGYCQGGWLNDTDGNIYFLYNQHDGNFGYMLTGWQLIEGKWYYFEPEAGKMQGHLYRNTTTPDGYRVDVNGVWIQ